jgi:hypothetical protein
VREGGLTTAEVRPSLICPHSVEARFGGSSSGEGEIRNAMFGNVRLAVKHDPLIRVRVLCSLLLEALEETDSDAFASPQLLEQLRDTGGRAAEELDQLRPSGRE